jgi:hypothetical protein
MVKGLSPGSAAGTRRKKLRNKTKALFKFYSFGKLDPFVAPGKK